MGENSSNQVEYPPFCELCLKKFNTNQNSKLHFDGPMHQNKVYLMFHKARQNENLVVCDICCVELNTLKALDQHKQSQKHIEKEQAWLEISELKKEYLKAKEEAKTD